MGRERLVHDTNSSRGQRPVQVPTPAHRMMQARRSTGNLAMLRALKTDGSGSDTAGGAAMPGPLRGALETLSGADLSDVRVHPNSALPSRLDSAAYAQGRDIHLGPGAEEHLAHEGWHAVQQMQGRVIPTTQVGGVPINDNRELEREADLMGARASQLAENSQDLNQQVEPSHIRSPRGQGSKVAALKAKQPVPGWGDPLFGKDDSYVSFDPNGRFVPTGLESAFREGRLSELVPAISAGRIVGTNMEEGGGYQGTIKVKAGTRGTVTISVKAHFLLDQKWNDEYDQNFACSWGVAVDERGRVTIGAPRRDINPPTDKEAEFSLNALDPYQDEKAPTVQITAVFGSYQVTDIPNWSVNLGVSGKVAEGGVGVVLGNERTYPAGTLAKTFALKINVTDVAPPKAEITFGPITIRRTRSHEVKFEREGQVSVSRSTEAALVQWYHSLSEETRQAVRDGREKVKLTGHASSTDLPPHNRRIAAGRVASVRRILEHLGVKQFDTASPGEYTKEGLEPEKAVADPKMRKVVVEVKEAPVTIE